ADVEDFHAAGVRLVGPAWLIDNEFVIGRLTQEGRELIDELSRLGMALDLSHMPDGAIGEAVERHTGMLVASHANSRSHVMNPPPLPASPIRAIAERDGVTATIPAAWTLPENPLDSVCDAIEVAAEAAGGIRHVAIGSDFDGGFGSEQTPDELDTVADLPRI